MEQLFLGIATLACPVGMGLMTWIMMRGRSKGTDVAHSGRQVEQLRAEIDQLKAERAGHPPGVQ